MVAPRLLSQLRGAGRILAPNRWPEPLILGDVGCRDLLAGQVRAADDQIGEHATGLFTWADQMRTDR